MPTGMSLQTAPHAESFSVYACPSVVGISHHASFLGVLMSMLTAVGPSLFSISIFLNIAMHIILNITQTKQDAC